MSPEITWQDVYPAARREVAPWLLMQFLPEIPWSLTDEASLHRVVTASSVGKVTRTAVSQPVKMEWYFDAVSQQEGADPTVGQLALYIKGINSVISHGQYSLLDKMLQDAAKKGVSSQVLLAFARASFPVRSKLAGWRRFLTTVAEKLDARGKNSAQLLKGLS